MQRYELKQFLSKSNDGGLVKYEDVSGILSEILSETHFNRLCNHVCKKIKEGWRISINLENGYGGAELIDPNGNVCEAEYDDMKLDEIIYDMVRGSNVLPEK